MNISDFDMSLLTIAAILTSGIAAILGQGGGIMLFALLAIYIDPPLLIAFHAVIQLSSNASRAAFAIPHINWHVISPILFGTLIGAILITPFISTANWNWMQPIIGVYILFLTWGKGISMPFSLPKPMLSMGILQGSLGMALGATGPLGNAILLAKGLSKNAIVASNAVIMSTSHASKVILFGLVGVSVLPAIEPIIFLSIAAIIGSYLGSKLRGFLPERLFSTLFKAILTLLALRMIVMQLIEL
ncbi:TSUP family transporter [Pseudomonas sp. HK3]